MEREIMERVNDEWGEHFIEMAKLRDRAVEELQDLKWTTEQFDKDPASILVLLLARAIGTLDLIRISLEHGYGVRSRNLIRSLIDLEIDAALLSTPDPELLLRYGAYEILEVARKAEQALTRIADSDEKAEATTARRDVLRQALLLMNREVPPGFETTALGEAADIFALEVFNRRYPPHWRLPLLREDWLNLAVGQLAEAAPSAIGDSAPAEGILWEIEYAYMWCSEAVHVSPRSVAESTVRDDGGALIGFVIGGQVTEIPSSWYMAGLHFVRMRLLVGAHVALPQHEDWTDLYKRFVADLFE